MSEQLAKVMDVYGRAQEQAHNQREVARMLGLWVSEFEPIIMWGADMIVRGLTVEGHDRAYVKAEPPWWIKDAPPVFNCRCTYKPIDLAVT